MALVSSATITSSKAGQKRRLAYWYRCSAQPRGAEMQFGRFHGIALIVLGGLLLLAQTFVIFAGSTKTERPKAEETSETESKPPTSFTRGFNYLPGVLGVAMVG